MMRWLLLATTGCATSYGPCLGNNEPTEAVAETLDGEVVFDWAPGTAYALSVYEYGADGETAREMWHVQCGGDNLEDDHRLETQVCIRTPIAYGEDVGSQYFDHVNFTRPKALTPGATYQVRIDTLVEDDGPPPPSDLPGWLQVFERKNRGDRDDPHCGSGFSAEADFVAP